MTNQLTSFERDVHGLTVRLLEEYRSAMRELELIADYRGVKVLDSAPATRCSELEVVFRRGRDVADIFEFFVEKDGVPNVSLREVEEWLRAELADLSSRHG